MRLGKIKIRKDWYTGAWEVTLPTFGFTPAEVVACTTHQQALDWALVVIAHRSAAVSLYATPGTEAWSPSTLRYPRQ